jgi:hypothetical protein
MPEGHFLKYTPFAKVDEQRHKVYGLVTAERVDKDNERCLYEPTKDAYKRWSAEASASTSMAGQEVSLGNVRWEHSLEVAGKATKLDYDDPAKAIYMEAEPMNDEIWDRIRRGFARGFSHSGSYGSRRCSECHMDIPKGNYCMSCMKTVTVDYSVGNLTEVSFVDSPCLGDAVYTYVKADGTEEQRQSGDRDPEAVLASVKRAAEDAATAFTEAMVVLKGTPHALLLKGTPHASDGKFTNRASGEIHDCLTVHGYQHSRSGERGDGRITKPTSHYAHPGGGSVVISGDDWEHNDGHGRVRRGIGLHTLKPFLEACHGQKAVGVSEHREFDKRMWTPELAQAWLTHSGYIITGQSESYSGYRFEIQKAEAMEWPPWIAVDLDGTLAEPVDHDDDPTAIGEPREEMAAQVRQWLKDGEDVRIFTARVANDPGGRIADAVMNWTDRHLGQRLRVTNEKDPGMRELWDDKAKLPPGIQKAAGKGIQFVIGFPQDGGGSEVQSVLFDKDKWTVEDAKQWLKDHDFKGLEVDQTENTLRFRQHDPGQYERMRTITPGAGKGAKVRKSEEEGIEFEGGRDDPDAVLFDTGLWDEEEARQWLEDNGYDPSEPEEAGGYWRFAQKAALLRTRLRKLLSKTDARTKRVAGEDLPASAFLLVGDPERTETWALPVRFSTKEKTQSHIRNALARFNQVQGFSEAEKNAAWKKLVALAKRNDIQVADDTDKVIVSYRMRKAEQACIKSMYDASMLAQLLQGIHQIRQSQIAEGQLEGGDQDNFAIAERLRAWLADGVSILKQIVEEETTELTAVPASTKAADHTKGASEMQPEMQEMLKAVTEFVKGAHGLSGHFKAAGSHHEVKCAGHGVMADSHKALTDHHSQMAAHHAADKVLGDHHKALSDHHAKAFGHHSAACKSHGEMSSQCKAVVDHLAGPTEKALKALQAVGIESEKIAEKITSAPPPDFLKSLELVTGALAKMQALMEANNPEATAKALSEAMEKAVNTAVETAVKKAVEEKIGETKQTTQITLVPRAGTDTGKSFYSSHDEDYDATGGLRKAG